MMTPAKLAEYWAQYHPPETGIHVVGFVEPPTNYGPHVTLASLALEAAVARAIFASLKADFADPADDYDVIVDLMVEGSCEDDLSMRRQMVDPFLRRVHAEAGA